jgi:hypothetical protein
VFGESKQRAKELKTRLLKTSFKVMVSSKLVIANRNIFVKKIND